MRDLEHALASASPNARSQDRLAVFQRGDTVVAVIADGAGGTAGGAEAASRVVEKVRQIVESDTPLSAPGLWRQTLLELSLDLEPIGQTTAVIVGGGRGASVGDSCAWLITRGGHVDLTEGQPRKPLLGGGFAEPHTFDVRLGPDDTLLVATDGLWKYLPLERLSALARAPVLSAEALVAAVHPLQDDVSVVLLRRGRGSRDAVVRRLSGWRGDAPGEAEALATELEAWLTDVIPREPAFRFDGVVLGRVASGRATGQVWRVDTQTLYPFEVELADGAVEVRFGDALFPDGLLQGRRQLVSGRPRDWLIVIRG